MPTKKKPAHEAQRNLPSIPKELIDGQRSDECRSYSSSLDGVKNDDD